MSQQDYIEAVKKFTNLQQANKLPSAREITIDVKINSTPQKTQTELLAEELKGE